MQRGHTIQIRKKRSRELSTGTVSKNKASKSREKPTGIGTYATNGKKEKDREEPVNV
jgi:hypothetical protein